MIILFIIKLGYTQLNSLSTIQLVYETVIFSFNIISYDIRLS